MDRAEESNGEDFDLNDENSDMTFNDEVESIFSLGEGEANVRLWEVREHSSLSRSEIRSIVDSHTRSAMALNVLTRERLQNPLVRKLLFTWNEILSDETLVDSAAGIVSDLLRYKSLGNHCAVEEKEVEECNEYSIAALNDAIVFTEVDLECELNSRNVAEWLRKNYDGKMVVDKEKVIFQGGVQEVSAEVVNNNVKWSNNVADVVHEISRGKVKYFDYSDYLLDVVYTLMSRYRIKSRNVAGTNELIFQERTQPGNMAWRLAEKYSDSNAARELSKLIEDMKKLVGKSSGKPAKTLWKQLADQLDKKTLTAGKAKQLRRLQDKVCSSLRTLVPMYKLELNVVSQEVMAAIGVSPNNMMTLKGLDEFRQYRGGKKDPANEYFKDSHRCDYWLGRSVSTTAKWADSLRKIGKKFENPRVCAIGCVGEKDKWSLELSRFKRIDKYDLKPDGDVKFFDTTKSTRLPKEYDILLSDVYYTSSDVSSTGKTYAQTRVLPDLIRHAIDAGVHTIVAKTFAPVNSKGQYKPSLIVDWLRQFGAKSWYVYDGGRPHNLEMILAMSTREVSGWEVMHEGVGVQCHDMVSCMATRAQAANLRRNASLFFGLHPLGPAEYPLPVLGVRLIRGERNSSFSMFFVENVNAEMFDTVPDEQVLSPDEKEEEDRKTILDSVPGEVDPIVTANVDSEGPRRKDRDNERSREGRRTNISNNAVGDSVQKKERRRGNKTRAHIAKKLG